MVQYKIKPQSNATIAEACGAENDVPSRLLLLTHVEIRDVEVKCRSDMLEYVAEKAEAQTSE